MISAILKFLWLPIQSLFSFAVLISQMETQDLNLVLGIDSTVIWI